MAEKYRVYYDELMGKKNLIDTDSPLEIEVMDVQAMEWISTKSLVSEQPGEGLDKVEVVGSFGNLVENKTYYIKIVEKENLSSEE